MNTDKILNYPIPVHTQQWYDFRRKGVGGSEAAIILGMSEYGNPTKMYYEKLGLSLPWMGDNEAMFWGRELEDEIAGKWQYWDGAKEGYMKNYATGTKVRKCRKFNAYMVNTDYPWLFGSVDRLINRLGGYSLINGEKLDDEGILECKTIENFVADKWELGIPISYIVQVHVYFIITGLQYGEIAVLKNGRYFDVIPIPRNENLCQQIIEKTQSFWYNHVEPAMPYARQYLKAKIMNNEKLANEAETFIHKFEPYPMAGDSYRNFLSERFTKKQDMVKAPAWLFSVARKHKEYSAAAKWFKNEASGCANIMGDFLVKNGADKVDLGKGRGFIHYQSRGGGVKFVDNRIKIKIDELKLMNEMKKIKLDIG